jgi:alcohol dehydrogenase class IV
MFPAPHGAVCAALLPHVMEVNLQALRERQPASQALTRYEQVGRLLTGNPEASADDGVDWVGQLVEDLKIPPLQHYGVTGEHAPDLIEKASRASSMKANPIPLTRGELTRILELAI